MAAAIGLLVAPASASAAGAYCTTTPCHKGGTSVVLIVAAIVVFFILMAVGIVWMSGRQIRKAQKEDPGRFSSGAKDDDVAGSPFD